MRGFVIYLTGMQYKIWENRRWLASPVPIYSTKQTQAKSLSIHLLSLYFLPNTMYFRKLFLRYIHVCTVFPVIENICSFFYHLLMYLPYVFNHSLIFKLQYEAIF